MATFKKYLIFQAMTLTFGIVGPIFLIVYFAAQPEPELRWMYFAGLTITTIDVLVALVLAGAEKDDAPVTHLDVIEL
ncbi:MAG: hypothetical protein U0R77_01090 [Mycolicibacterium insubricum]|jgi:hypothetical protein|uniref:Uncharacterized protein n=1 Tax=Mycolicibacterium insubricum TaxID=444597 RepID=A0A1X0DLT2_9MYCO|nr:hypothetical protein [Mycolicibacterium insubricum]MCB0928819.1 hypothetical protein [Mycobacterium sp.]MCB9441944.1 hypothetical protein [Mycolicibacterium sp.]MCV7081011.1 hypothetical protein [Mycolicibacterium insubricum]ORA73122.1 hypothetical protein BST26_03580 [Mycolicibacterium insubricum]BBZ68528.1 hypothetical protein MINS_39570 [Mycolicibacterium insubricum]